jgi:hypothetical protein
LDNYLDFEDRIYRLACELYKLKHLNRRKRTKNEWLYLLKKQVEYGELLFGYNNYMLGLYKNKHSEIKKEFEFQTNAAKNILLDYRDQYLDFIEYIEEKH